MTIREYAKEHDHEVVGKLTRRTDWEDWPSAKWYTDEAGNEYCVTRSGVSIILADGGVI
jgi:hypothetical protein